MTSPKTFLIALALASAALPAGAADEPASGEARPSAESNAVDGTGTFSVNPGIGDVPAVLVNPQDLHAEGDDRAPTRASKDAVTTKDRAWKDSGTPKPSTT
jgi:hypothetical protein